MPLSKSGRTFEIGKALSIDLKWSQYHKKIYHFSNGAIGDAKFCRNCLVYTWKLYKT